MTAGPEAMPPDHTLLSPEEHALAQRLARLGMHVEPSPALDARILAAAHAAVVGGSTRSQRRGKRWPLLFGVAASLALAVGIAWRLRPLPDATPAYQSEAASASATALPAAVTATDPDADPYAVGMIGAEATAVDRQTAPEPAAARAPHASAPAPSEPEAFPQSPRTARTSAPPLPEESPIVFDQSSPMAVPPPPPATPPTSTAPAVENAQAGAAASSNTIRSDTTSPDAMRSDAPSSDAIAQPRVREASKPVATEYGIEEDVPPATADAPEVRDAWLQRIRELAAAGRLDDARTSLREFIRRYPDYPLPDDVRALNP